MTDHDQVVKLNAVMACRIALIADAYPTNSMVTIAQGYSRNGNPSYIHVTFGGSILGDSYQITTSGRATRL